MNESEPAKHRCIFAKTQSNVRKWFWRCVAGKTGSCFRGMSDEGRAPGEQRDDYGECGTWVPKHLNGKQRAADRTNDGVDRVPSGVDPRNFVREKFEEIKDSRDDNNHWVAKDFERLICRSERDPMEMNGEAGGKNRQVKIDTGEASQAQGDCKQIQFFHGEIIGMGARLSRASCSRDRMTNAEGIAKPE